MRIKNRDDPGAVNNRRGQLQLVLGGRTPAQ
jgi:hypothetical protein